MSAKPTKKDLEKLLKKAVEQLREAENTLDDAEEAAWQLTADAEGKGVKKAEEQHSRISLLASLAWDIRRLVEQAL
ncbi:hypothetical protein [Mycobacterium sp. AZCC_0083]|uniref:hypothetical protein n=1 Tax=Mycobacterium sp. AZCC_0083 TaxID=2735882 RepID=UPI00161D7F1E|nr:hypothetical protein [Mycobacterium sp. AZCC_0083]MBB5167219.1 vacuolar-type H+-ATPase subunit H [Mycobacterium sp. AZCC_0083]